VAVSAAYPLTVALEAALSGHQGVAGVVGLEGVHSLKAGAHASLPYILLGSSAEGDSSVFGRKGFENEEELHLYTPIETQKEGALQLYAQVHDALDRKLLPLAGHDMVYGTLELVIVLEDEDGEAVHTFARYITLNRR
jgi:hypothetical protein